MRRLENELILETEKMETEFCHEIHEQKVEFAAAAKASSMGKRPVPWR
jgi:hypothetical protein